MEELKCGKCERPLGPYRIFWPLYGSICGSCRAKLEEGSIVETAQVLSVDHGILNTISRFEHIFEASVWSWSAGKRERWMLCRECGQLRPFKGEMQWYEQGECPAKRERR